MGSDPGDRDDAAALRTRLNRLSSELKGRAGPRPTAQPSAESKPGGMGSAMSLGLRAGSEFVSAIIVGAGIGWVLDRALGTNPAFLIVFFMIGVAAGVWNVIRVTSPKGVSPGRNSPLSRAGPPDKDGRRSASGAEQGVLHSRRNASGGAAHAPDRDDDDED